ncbi:MAG: DUF72 domain-containing protein [Planctomycetota bacterium]|nr:DUF72 domain-containing protein [Planctomycetota bacterium]
MLRIGTAGFSYKDWHGPVYPDPKPAGFDALRFLADFFPCVEMNTSFYGVPKPASVAKWVETVRDHDDFRFTFKLYRGLTHGTEDDQLAPFLEALAPCRDAGRLGAILLQFPFFFRNTQPNRARLGWLAAGLRGWPCAVEVRDNSWLQPAALDFLRRLDLNLCDIDICQTRESVPPGAWTTGPLGYVRLHGRNADAWFDKRATVNEKYNYLYSETELKEWVEHVRRIVAETDSTYVITNNHFGGRAVANGLQLLKHLTGDAPAAPPQLRQAFPELAAR